PPTTLTRAAFAAADSLLTSTTPRRSDWLFRTWPATLRPRRKSRHAGHRSFASFAFLVVIICFFFVIFISSLSSFVVVFLVFVVVIPFPLCSPFAITPPPLSYPAPSFFVVFVVFVVFVFVF